jgi:hypothetical protein
MGTPGMRRLRIMAVVLAVVALAASARAQTAVTSDDLVRLETTAAGIDQQLATLRRTDATLATEVAKSLADLRDEVIYLKVKLRRDGSVTRAEYAEVRDRLETLRIRAQGQKVMAQPVPGEPMGRVWTVPVGAELDVRLQTPLNSGTAEVETRFEATTTTDLKMGANEVVIPAGTLVRGFVGSVRAAGKIERKGSLTLSFDELVIGPQHVRLRASVEQAIDSQQGEDLTRIGAGATVGAIIGGILGGGKGALVGVLVGGGGTMASTEGSDIDLPVGTILRLRIDQPIDISVGG